MGGRGFGKWGLETPESMEPYCKLTTTIIKEKQRTKNTVLGRTNIKVEKVDTSFAFARESSCTDTINTHANCPLRILFKHKQTLEKSHVFEGKNVPGQKDQSGLNNAPEHISSNREM